MQVGSIPPLSQYVNTAELCGVMRQAFMGEVFASFLFIWVIMGLVKSKK